MLKVSLLQTPHVELDGQTVAFPYKRADALLYYMLVRRSATRQELISLLWESCDETTGLKNLRNTLYTLKKSLGGEFLLSPQKSLVTVNPQWELDCDYDRFTRGGDFSAYQGPFLQGFVVKQAFCFEEWLCRTRDKLHDQYLGRLEEQARVALQTGQPEQAAQWAAEYLREDPFNERMTAFLMERWRETSQYAKAAQVYQHLKERLSEEMGTDPLESTTLLYYEIMNQWNDTTGEPDSHVPVGRESAYAALRAAADSFEKGAVRRCSQLLEGEVGSGKSGLLDQFLQKIVKEKFFTIRCGCLQSEAQLPLHLWDRVLFLLLEFIREKEVPLPVSVQARLNSMFSESGQARLASHALRQWNPDLEDSVLMAVKAAARRKKILLILEDLQWMDFESLRLTDGLLRRLEGMGLMLVLTSRDDCGPDARQMLDRAVADGLLRRHRLHPLDREQTQELLRRDLGEEAAIRLAERFYLETGGNLYLLIELVQAYRRSGDAEATIGAAEDILMERLGGLGESEMRLAGIVSVFPQEAPYPILLELLEQDDRRLTDGLAQLLRRGLLEERRTDGDAVYRFTHQRIRELVYERLAFFERQPLHLRIAKLLSASEQLGDSVRCRRVARHFELAGDSLRSLEFRVRALDLESERSCEPFPLPAGDAAPRIMPKELQAEAQKELRELLLLRRSRQDAAPLLARLERTLTLVRGRVGLFEGDTDDSIEILGGLSALDDEKGDLGTLVRACYLLASSAIALQQVHQAERYTSTGMRLLERSRDVVQQARFQRLRGNCFCLQGAYDKGTYYLLEAVDELERQPQTRAVKIQLAAAGYDYGRLLRQKQDYAGACSCFKKALGLLEEEPWAGVVWIYVHYGRTAFLLEDHFKARELFRRGYDISRTTGELWGRTAAAAFTAFYQAQEGDYECAVQSLADAQDYARRWPSPLEGTILCFASMRIRQQLDMEQRNTALEHLLSHPADSYARQGIRMVSDIPDVFEAELLARSLRNGIAAQQRYRASELYSKNKLMTE